MRKIILNIIFILCLINLSKAQHEGIERHFDTWKLNYSVDSFNSHYHKDTLTNNFHLFEPYYNQSIHGGMLTGNNGQAYMPYEYFKRKSKKDFIFNTHYQPYYISNDEVVYYNARKPFSRFDFYTGAAGYEDVNGLITVNATPFLNAGIRYHSIKTDGFFINSLSKLKNFILWESYTGKKYQNHFNVRVNSHEAMNFGGISDDSSYIETETKIPNLDVNLNNASTQQKSSAFYYSHELRFGKLSEDTIITEKDTSLKVTYNGNFSLYQDIKLEKHWRIYSDVPGNFYDNIYLDSTETFDSTSLLKATHQAGFKYIHIKDSIKQFRVFGGVINEFKQFYIRPDKIAKQNHFIKFNIKDLKNAGINYSADVKYGIIGRRQSDFESLINLSADIASAGKLSLKNDFAHKKVNYFFENYSSNNFSWNNEFNNEKYFITRINYSDYNTGINFNFNHAIRDNMIYINNTGLPSQYDKNINILSAGLSKGIKLGHFGLKSNIVYQKVLKASVINVPEILGFAGVYYKNKIFDNNMDIQIGLDTRYRSKFKANGFIPSTGLFSVQNQNNIDEVFLFDGYLIFKVKRLRAFFRYTNIGSLFLNTSPYSLSNYPERPAALRFGFSWEFYN